MATVRARLTEMLATAEAILSMYAIPRSDLEHDLKGAISALERAKDNASYVDQVQAR